jgi:hypothetical protein
MVTAACGAPGTATPDKVAIGIGEKNKVPYIGVAFALQKVHNQGFKNL